MNIFTLFLVTLALTASVRTDDAMNEYLMKLVNNFKAIMPIGDKDLNIPPLDPLKIDNVNQKVDKPKVTLSLKLNNLVATGLSNFEVTKLDSDLSDFHIQINLRWKAIKITGNYDINGKVMKFIPIYGSGIALIGVENFDLESSISLNVDVNSGKLSLKDIKLGVNFASATIYLEKILGGGSLGDLVNLAVNTLATPMFEKKRPEIENAINKIVVKLLKKELEKINLKDIMKSPMPYVGMPDPNNINKYVDQLLNNLKSDPKLQIDPIAIPDHNSKQHHIKININGGRVYGLKTVHRVGNMLLKCVPNTAKCSFTGEIGVDNVRGHFNTKMRYHFIKIHPSIDIKMSSLRIRIGINLNLAGQPGQIATLASFGISHMSTPKFSIGHLGPFGKVLQFLSNLLVPLFKNKVKSAIESPMKNALVDQLKKVKFDF